MQPCCFLLLRADKKIDMLLPLQNWQFSSQLRILRDPWVRIVCYRISGGALFHGVHAFPGTFLQERFNLSILVSGLLVASLE